MLQTLRQLRQEVRRDFFWFFLSLPSGPGLDSIASLGMRVGAVPPLYNPSVTEVQSAPIPLSLFPPGLFFISVVRVDMSPGGSTVCFRLRASLEVDLDGQGTRH